MSVFDLKSVSNYGQTFSTMLKGPDHVQRSMISDNHSYLPATIKISGSQGQHYYSLCPEMQVKDGKIIPEKVYESQRLQCNMYHTPSMYDGAVFGFGKSNRGDALQCTDFQTDRLIW